MLPCTAVIISISPNTVGSVRSLKSKFALISLKRNQLKIKRSNSETRPPVRSKNSNIIENRLISYLRIRIVCESSTILNSSDFAKGAGLSGSKCEYISLSRVEVTNIHVKNKQFIFKCLLAIRDFSTCFLTIISHIFILQRYFGLEASFYLSHTFFLLCSLITQQTQTLLHNNKLPSNKPTKKVKFKPSEKANK